MPIAATASRFACLQDDDSADWKAPKAKSKPKREEPKMHTDSKPKDAAKAKAMKDAKELQNLAFGGQKKKNKKKGQQQQPQPNQPCKPVKAPEEPIVSAETESVSSHPLVQQQFEEWKEKDKVLVDDNFTAAMQEAIMQSKLEFEQQQALKEAQERLLANGMVTESVLSSLSKEERKRIMKLQKKPTTMSLEQFNTETNAVEKKVLETPTAETQVYRHPRHKDRVSGLRVSPSKEVKEGEDFFNQMDAAALKALNREQLLESYRSQESTNGSESALVANYREKLVVKEQELHVAKTEIQSLNTKLNEVKLRSKKLTEILMSGEMREKTEVLVQVNKLEKVRDELSSSLAFTSGQLEQERSLIHQLEVEFRKGAGGSGGEQEFCNRMLSILKNRK